MLANLSGRWIKLNNLRRLGGWKELTFLYIMPLNGFNNFAVMLRANGEKNVGMAIRIARKNISNYQWDR